MTLDEMVLRTNGLTNGRTINAISKVAFATENRLPTLDQVSFELELICLFKIHNTSNLRFPRMNWNADNKFCNVYKYFRGIILQP